MLLNAIRERYSVRKYLNRPVEEEKLLRVLDAGRLAPSARNMQEWRFISVTDSALRHSLSEAANNQKFVAEAPVVIVGCSIQDDYIMRCGHPAHLIDLAIAMDHMTLQAIVEGLGTCWIGAFYPELVRPILNIPNQIPIIQMLTLGYPAESKERGFIKNRMPLNDVYSKNEWNKGWKKS